MKNTMDRIELKDLRIPTIIGIFDWERKQKQDVSIDLIFPCNAALASLEDHITATIDYKRIAKETISFVETSEFQLLETLADRLATHLIKTCDLPEIHLRASKPGAIRGSKNISIHITRFAQPDHIECVYLSLGSNIEPQKHLFKAVSLAKEQFDQVRFSHVYETSPVGDSIQPPFWNLAMELQTEKSIDEIQAWNRTVEGQLGRIRSDDPNSPRTIDIDLLLYGSQVTSQKASPLPHPDLYERAYALFPLLELAPSLVEPMRKRPILELAKDFHAPDQGFIRLSEDPLLPLR